MGTATFNKTTIYIQHNILVEYSPLYQSMVAPTIEGNHMSSQQTIKLDYTKQS